MDIKCPAPALRFPEVNPIDKMRHGRLPLFVVRISLPFRASSQSRTRFPKWFIVRIVAVERYGRLWNPKQSGPSSVSEENKSDVGKEGKDGEETTRRADQINRSACPKRWPRRRYSAGSPRNRRCRSSDSP